MTVDQSRSYSVIGMTCDHCVASVREEVSQVPGVRDVEVDLATGHVAVSGDGFADEAVSAAVDEAGYELAS